ncbi:MgtC/SapB family protein [Herbidospora sp. NEAU-GS84]|uniref:MgtC/SapB family protein n=1 Tax=Herbidospora solisilvae TaxID=2696284 RepID=A0A7C9N281_9ACTN|nr:MgtC/SapB family protein [Herbidospora solisilvae]NAS23489.1 MgtC/SapB family protein [Herbidospora solisilvae]
MDFDGQGWAQIGELALAMVLSAAIGLERERRQHGAGLRTHTLVGVGAALFMIVSKYGFTDVLSDEVLLDPSRVAAQIVSGIGFIGGGLIFVRRDIVRGLTTAAVVWVTTAVGMAAGAGLWVLAVAVTAGHFLIILGLPPLAALLPRSKFEETQLRLTYVDGKGVLRQILTTCGDRDWSVRQMTVDRETRPGTVSIRIVLQGGGSIPALTLALTDLEGVLAVSTEEPDL